MIGIIDYELNSSIGGPKPKNNITGRKRQKVLGPNNPALILLLIKKGG